jgi:Zn-dependent peptidase ImmA (M78 family)
MRHGFKTWAESEAKNRRLLEKLSPGCALPARAIAKQLEIRVVTPEEMGVDSTDLGVLLKGERSHWSAMTLYFRDEPFVVHNPTHSGPRQETDLMHEFAHLICKHPPCRQ